MRSIEEVSGCMLGDEGYMSRDEGAIIRAQQRLGQARMLLPGLDVELHREEWEDLATWEIDGDEAGGLDEGSDSEIVRAHV